MRLVLKSFQEDAVDELVEKLRRAAREVHDSGDLQAVGLSSPTGSGKTVIVTAAIERLLQGDSDHESLPDAVVLWITDQPQLNEQTRRKMLKDSSILKETNLITIGPAFDQEVLTPGTVNFLNIQKLGKERDLITKGDERNHTIWETITNTVAASPDRLFVVIDEAHRGMMESPQARSEANTIIQKFIKGSPGEVPKVPLVVGISATLERFNTLIGGAGRTMRPIDIPIEDVRASGLLKEVVTLHHPTREQPTDITMLREAAKSWQKFMQEWERYCREQGEPAIRPILVVQVQDAAGKTRVSKTDLDEAVKAIEDELGGLPPSAFAHSFQESTTQVIAGKEVRYLAPADIDSDPEVQVVFFKTSLNTGWDCPRAEVMMSFRTALDATSIAQLVGRMVRNPLARQVETSDFLNSVSLYLPHYDESGLTRVIERLTTPDPEAMPPIEFRRGQDQVTVVRAAGLDRVFQAIESLPSYVIPARRKTSQIRRLMKFARALANDEIEPDAEDVGLFLLMDVIQHEFTRVSETETFKKLVEERGKVEIRAVDWQVGLDSVREDSKIVLDVSSEDIDQLFEAASRRIGDEGLHKEWWKARRRKKIDSTTAKLELVALSVDNTLRRRLDDAAQKKVQEWLKTHNHAVSLLSEARRQLYDEIRARARDPELRTTSLPKDMTVSKSEDLWVRHIFIDEASKYPAKLNKWESAVVKKELDGDKRLVWLRNIPRKPWALTIPYSSSGKAAGFYPDFVFVREKGGQLAIDLLDPHHIELADAPAKAVGLAQYAAKHADVYNRIELIIVRGEDEICSIDLTDEAKREKVLAVRTKEHLAHLFEV